MPERVNVLELRSVRGTGGGPEKTIMLGAAQADPREFAVTVCYIRDARDRVFSLGERAAGLGLDYVEVFERHSLDPGIWPALRRLVRERAIHIVHAHEYKTDLLALLLARAERVVPVATVHGWTGHTVRERIVYYPADRRLLARYPRLIAVSGEIREQLVAAGARADCVSVVLNGIDPERFRRDPARVSRAREALGYEPAHLVVGAVGRLEAQKRFDLLIDAVARLLPDHPSVRLVIAGGGSLFHELQRHAGRVLPDGSWRLLGHTDDVGEVYHAIDVLVQSSDYEGTPNAVLEAMAFETPVVATDVGGTSELAQHGDHALIVPPGRSDLLAEAIVAIVREPAAARARTRAARRRVELDLSFTARMRRVEGIYRELMAARGGRSRPAGMARTA